MSQLTIYTDDNADEALLSSDDIAIITNELRQIGIQMERWKTDQTPAPDADNETILAAYQDDIDRLVSERGYQTWDVVSMNTDHPEKDAFRHKFLNEHTHSEDEVRFFVRGQGLFVIHAEQKVFAILCEQDDLISVPANTKHWFDMGPNPAFTAIRLFNDPAGWVANFTGDEIAANFPMLDN